MLLLRLRGFRVSDSFEEERAATVHRRQLDLLARRGATRRSPCRLKKRTGRSTQRPRTPHAPRAGRRRHPDVTLYQGEAVRARTQALFYLPNEVHIVLQGSVTATLNEEGIEGAVGHTREDRAPPRLYQEKTKAEAPTRGPPTSSSPAWPVTSAPEISHEQRTPRTSSECTWRSAMPIERPLTVTEALDPRLLHLRATPRREGRDEIETSSERERVSRPGGGDFL